MAILYQLLYADASAVCSSFGAKALAANLLVSASSDCARTEANFKTKFKIF